MAEVNLLDQLSNYEAFMNQDSKLIIASLSYEQLMEQYEKPENKEYFENLAKSIMICAPRNPMTGEDIGNYQLVAIAPSGKPIPITPVYSPE